MEAGRVSETLEQDFISTRLIFGEDFDVLLTVRLSIFILVFNQLDAQNLFYNKFISCIYMFRALLCSSSGGQIVLYSL